MADLGNQLEGVSEGLERFLDSLDNTSIKLSNNAISLPGPKRFCCKPVPLSAREVVTIREILEFMKSADEIELQISGGSFSKRSTPIVAINGGFSGFFEIIIYKIYKPFHRSDLKISTKPLEDISVFFL